MRETVAWTLQEVANKRDYEGGWDALWGWGGPIYSTDITLNILFKRFGEALDELEEYWGTLNVEPEDET